MKGQNGTSHPSAIFHGKLVCFIKNNKKYKRPKTYTII